jgi:hypothetical protein
MGARDEEGLIERRVLSGGMGVGWMGEIDGFGTINKAARQVGSRWLGEIFGGDQT